MNFFSIFSDKSKKIGLILLNTSIGDFKIFDILWGNACFKVFLDGFSNQIIHKKLDSKYIPNVLIGDFDSVEPQVLQKYKSMQHVKVVHDKDQNSTDLDKGLMYLSKNCPNLDTVVVFYKSGGRFDHLFGAINSLYLAKGIINTDVILVSEMDICALLSQGEHVIVLDKTMVEGSCGLIPIGFPVTVTTSGLKWNLDNSKLQFGELVSTSNNLIGSDKVTIKCDNYLLWSMTYKLTDQQHQSNGGVK